jgi:hypothetical protein
MRAGSFVFAGGWTMLARSLCLAWMTGLAAVLSGCCCGPGYGCGEPWGGCYPCGKNYCAPSCGELFWSEWFSIPPECCDPCDDCGGFVGPRLNDALYSHGNDYHGWCEKRDAHRHRVQQSQYQAEEIQGEIDPAPTPAPAAEPYYENSGPMTRRVPSRGSHPVRRTSYQEPMPKNSRMAPRPQAQRLFSPAPQRPVDSYPSSRTLARPPRTRLFSQ